MNYPGSKNGSGVYQQIINQLPPHDLYVELFAGSGAILRKKRPAACSIAIDADPSAVAAMRSSDEIPLATNIIHGDVMDWLSQNKKPLANTVIYADPPYLMESRSAGREIYNREFHTEAEHIQLLDALLQLDCPVAISGYWSQLYMDKLRSWRWITFTGQTRGGPQTEWLWMNYPEPTELHDYQYLGEDYRERERIKRKKNRWKKKLQTMPSTERYAILAAIREAVASIYGNGDNAGTPYPPSSTVNASTSPRNSAIFPPATVTVCPSCNQMIASSTDAHRSRIAVVGATRNTPPTIQHR
jgi:DNA adenine methylase